MMKNLLESWNRYLLVELKYEEVLPRLDSQKFLNSCNYHNVDPQQTKEALLSTVPEDIEDAEKANYLNWRIKQFMVNGPIQGGPIKAPNKKYVEEFYMIKANNLDRMLTKNDINAFESVQEFTDMMKKASLRWRSYQARKKAATVEEGDIKKIYEDDRWSVYIPESKAASCHLGVGTRWCTASRGTRNMYKQYHSPNNPLIIFISKQNPSKKYQFSYLKRQFMDKEDKGVHGKPIFFELNEIVKKIKDLPKQVLDAAKKEKFESLPNGGYVTRVMGYHGPTTTYYNSLGQKDREDGPALIFKQRNGGTVEKWYRNDELHREDGPAKISDEGQEWYKHGVLHREDGPAVIHSGGIYQGDPREMWFKDGKLHREDGPAVIGRNVKNWYLNGNLHRDDGPAQNEHGIQVWYKHGLPHRDDGPARIDANGDQTWFKNGKLHRVGGPAVIGRSGETWYQNDKLHRLDGPAESSSYGKYYSINGKTYRSQKAWEAAKQKLGLTSEPETKPEVKPKAEKQIESDYTSFKFDF